ncbi:hypothetical protein CYMTET_53718 [Cymbomonas tetramitiformis]|uniref:Reverse transcriptase domain-containing protein n=1 Tax=Cymbomonas tetramitiformis TaxID=36881 RepID=A0AAE0BI57_9CHLO|nr:hypothetical protein CYMTET_53718 [Cymbomonas tetramitiformis]
MSRTYVAVEWCGKCYEFCVLPFGLAPACWVFTKINKELVGKWRALGFCVYPYVDDFAFAVRPPTLTDPAALAVLSRIMQNVREAGWLVAEAKSQPFFTRILMHIGIGMVALVPLRLVAKFAGLVNTQWEFEAQVGALSKIKDHDDCMANPAIFRWANPWIPGGWRHTRDRSATDKNCLASGIRRSVLNA